MHDTRQAGSLASARPSWPRRVLLGLWVLAFAVAGVELASHWDSLMSRLAGLRSASTNSGGSGR